MLPSIVLLPLLKDEVLNRSGLNSSSFSNNFFDIFSLEMEQQERQRRQEQEWREGEPEVQWQEDPWQWERRAAEATSNIGIPEQACGFAPSTPDGYWYEESQCSQAGSYLYRFGLLYVYLAGCFWGLLTVLGQVVRVFSKPEPWLFNPKRPEEFIVWKLLRYCAP